MTPVLGGVAAVVATVVIVWLLAGGARLIRRSYLGVRSRLRRDPTRSAKPQAVDMAERDWIYSDRPARHAPQAVGSPSEGAEASLRPRAPVIGLDPGAAAILQHAEAEATAIVKQAEQQAREILATAEEAKMRLEQDAARQRALAAEERTKLTAFLSDVLEEVQRGGVAATVRDLNKLRELKERASGGDENQAGSGV